MCGIFAYIGYQENILKYFMKIKNRGPDNHTLKQITHNLSFGFHRLAINDISFRGNQPFYHPQEPYAIICNGEIYNSDDIYDTFFKNILPMSYSDCEVLLYLYDLISKTEQDINTVMNIMLNKLDSESFAFCFYDGKKNKLFLARDRFGVRPLFYSNDNNLFWVSSERKGIPKKCSVKQFPPSHFAVYDLGEGKLGELVQYYNYSYENKENELSPVAFHNNKEFEFFIKYNIRSLLENAVQKRLMSDRPMGCLLSGGLDSSLIAALVANFSNRKLHTFTIGIKDSIKESPDVKYAKIVASHINSIHHTVELSQQDFLSAIEKVIRTIESYDVTTVRASTANYLIGEYIKKNTEVIVIFNGDGSDEQSGYRYLQNAPSETEFKNEINYLLRNIHYFDVLRSDRCLSSEWSLETRSPFLDTNFVEFYNTIPTSLKMYSKGELEKKILRASFDNCLYDHPTKGLQQLLPDEVLWRPKEAFSDGCSNSENSWHKIIQNHIATLNLTEEEYYLQIFEKYYPNSRHLIPHYWRPKWTEVTDPSAREL